MGQDDAAAKEVQHLEKRVTEFVSSVNKRLDENNSKLDLLIDLTRQMAVLQEKQDHNTDDIRTIENLLKDKDKALQEELRKIEDKMDQQVREHNKSIERLHVRVDESKDLIGMNHREVNATITAVVTSLKEEISKVNTSVSGLNDDYKSKVNFFKGIFFAFAIFSGIGQGILYKYFGEIENNIADTKIAIQRIENRFNETERQIDLIQHNVRNTR